MTPKKKSGTSRNRTRHFDNSASGHGFPDSCIGPGRRRAAAGIAADVTAALRGATLLGSNARDFADVPGLAVEGHRQRAS